MINEKEQGIYIPMKIWTIKILNLNEKIILSDIYNKSLRDEFKGYNKKIETLSRELSKSKEYIDNILKDLQRKGFIFSNPLKDRNNGKFKTVLSKREINWDNFHNTERYVISEENRFYKNSKEGCYFSFKDIKIINSWHRTKQKKKAYCTLRDRLLVLYLIIKKIGFIHDNNPMKISEIYARFTIQELAEYMGKTRQTVGVYLNGNKKNKGLTEKDSYSQKTIRALYRIGDEEHYDELCDMLDYYKPMTTDKKKGRTLKFINEYGEEEEKEIDNSNNLYYINIHGLQEIGIDFDIRDKINNYQEKKAN